LPSQHRDTTPPYDGPSYKEVWGSILFPLRDITRTAWFWKPQRRFQAIAEDFVEADFCYEFTHDPMNEYTRSLVERGLPRYESER
jgi:hypothetical protein